MLYSGAGHVVVFSRAIGKPLAQLSAGSSQTFFLTQPRVIPLQASPSLVASYQPQGQDLILHMQDGSILAEDHPTDGERAVSTDQNSADSSVVENSLNRESISRNETNLQVQTA